MKPEWGYAFSGGVLVGLSAALLLFANRRIAGVSGILGGMLQLRRGDLGWRVAFVLGMVLVGVAASALWRPFDLTPLPSAPLLIAAGLLVGFGTRLGGGCTSGHGICGIGRGSRRSIVATLCFMFTAMLTVYVVRHVV